MSRLAGDTTDRMREAFTIEMSAATKEAHESSIGAALNTFGATSTGVRTPRWRLRVPAFVAALLVVAPVGAAFASESAVPGDLLYPVKRLVEPIRSVVDSDVVAQHRVDELAHFLDMHTEADRLSDAVQDARDAVSDLPADHHLRVAFDRLTDRATNAAPVDVPSHDEVDSDHPATDTSTDRSPTDVPDDRSHETDTSTDPTTDDVTTETHERDDGSDSHTEQPPPERDEPATDG